MRQVRVMRRAGQWAVSLGLSAVCLWLAFRHVHMAAVGAQLRGLELGHVVLYALGLCGVQLCRAWRWRLLVRPFSSLSGWGAFRTSNVGTLFIMLMPLRLGELVRPAMVRRETGAPFAATLSAVAVERVLDGLVVTLLFWASSWMVDWPRGLPVPLAWAAHGCLVLFGAAAAGLVALYVARGWVFSSLTALGARGLPVAPAEALCRACVQGVGVLPHPGTLLGVVASTCGYWAANALGLWALMAAFGWPWPFANAALLVSILCIGILLPAGPGFLGTYQAALVLGLEALGARGDEALAYALCAYVINLAVVLAFGLPHILLEGLPEGLRGRAAAAPERAGRARTAL